MAETTLIAEGLLRLASSVEGLPLLAAKNVAGVFPVGKAGKDAAAFCTEGGLVRVLRHDTVGRGQVEVCTLTDTGVAWLRAHTSAGSALECLAASLQGRTAQLDEWKQQIQRQQDQVQLLSTLIESLARKARDDAAKVNGCLALDATILSELHAWQGRNPLKDCSLPDLFLAARKHWPVGTIGEFHDACRRLCEERKVYLHPWTGPLYEIPEPALAFLFGHEIAYYASLRAAADMPSGGTYILDDAAVQAGAF